MGSNVSMVHRNASCTCSRQTDSRRCCDGICNRYQKDAGVVRATEAVLALLEAAESTGRVDILENKTVFDLKPHGQGFALLRQLVDLGIICSTYWVEMTIAGQGVTVSTADGERIDAGAVVVAAGGWVRRHFVVKHYGVIAFSDTIDNVHVLLRNSGASISWSLRSYRSSSPHNGNHLSFWYITRACSTVAMISQLNHPLYVLRTQSLGAETPSIIPIGQCHTSFRTSTTVFYTTDTMVYRRWKSQVCIPCSVLRNNVFQNTLAHW